MAEQAKFPTQHQANSDRSLYCSDPNCIYCRELRKMQEDVKSHRRAAGATQFSNAATNGKSG